MINDIQPNDKPYTKARESVSSLYIKKKFFCKKTKKNNDITDLQKYK